ncbi:hypothetical protein LINPERPRIM_LOCUS30239 [Linum perenne]
MRARDSKVHVKLTRIALMFASSKASLAVTVKAFVLDASAPSLANFVDEIVFNSFTL